LIATVPDLQRPVDWERLKGSKQREKEREKEKEDQGKYDV
jgi:hypothetical protein